MKRSLRKLLQRIGRCDELDFSGGVRGKHAKRYAQGCNVVVLDADVARPCPDAEAMYCALRALPEVSAHVIWMRRRGRLRESV